MLTSWLTVTFIAAASASPPRVTSGRFPLSVAPTCRVNILPRLEFILNCGDGKNTGLVRCWYTPFGKFRFPGSHNELDPVFMNQDGSLVISNSSSIHRGLYSCFLQSGQRASLWPYELHTSYDHEENQDINEHERSSSCHKLRIRRTAAPGDKDAGVSEEQLGGTVAASVVVTFLVGFSAGALARKHLRRCLEALMAKKRSFQRKRQSERTDVVCEIGVETLPAMYDNTSLDMDLGVDVLDTTVSSSTSSPPPPQKPKRSFKNKYDEQEATTYLERCDYKMERTEEQEEQEEQEEEQKENPTENRECDVYIEREVCEIYVSDDAESETETNEEIYSRDEEEDTEEEREEKGELEDVEGECNLEENGYLSGEENGKAKREERGEAEDGSEAEDGKEKIMGQREEPANEDEEVSDVETEDDEGDEEENRSDEEHSQHSSSDSDDDKTGTETTEDTKDNVDVGDNEASSSPPHPARSRRVIRLYQYDDDGQRYCHLPEPSPEVSARVLTQKQRSVSMTRLNAIMAAASAGPMDRREEDEDGVGRPQFHIDI